MALSRHPTFPPSLRPDASPLRLDAGQAVFRSGAAPRYIHFVEEGAVRLVRHGRQGEEVVLHDARPGEFFAEASLDSARYHCDAITSEASVVLRASKAALAHLITSDPAFALGWVALQAAQLRAARARVERLSLRSAQDRVRHLLLSEGRGPQCELALDGSLKDLARRLGLSHESLYRTLAAMERAGQLERQDGLLRLRVQNGSGL